MMRVAALLMGITMATAANAAERFPELRPEQMTPAQKQVAEAIVSGPRGSIRGPFNAWLRSPELADRLQRVGEYLRFNTSLDKRLNEMAILMTAQAWGAQYEWFAHYPLAIKAGLDPATAADIGAGRKPAKMKDDEAIVWAFTTQLRRDHSVDDATYAQAVKAFGEQGVMDLIAVNGYYDLVSMTLNVAKLMPPAGETMPFAQAGR